MKRGIVKYQVGLRLARVGYPKMEDAAAAVGIAPSYISNILAGRERPVKHQKALAKLCGCTATELFGEWTNPELKAVEAASKAKEAK